MGGGHGRRLRRRSRSGRVNGPRYTGQVFFFFSSRLGCLGSLLVSVILTVLLILVLKRI
jgi:hypothetical protein